MQYRQFKQYNQSHYYEAPKKLYIVDTDQATFKVRLHNMDYKKTVENLRAAGYTGINITCLGKDVTILS